MKIGNDDYIYKSELVKRELARRYFYYFVKYVYPNYNANWHHKVICDEIDKLLTVYDYDRLMIFTPPRHGKSVIVSELLPIYVIGKFSNYSIIATSYGQKLINKMSRFALNHMRSQAYKNVFPGVITSKKKSAVEEWETTNSGIYKCAGVGGGITGLGFNLGIIDDPVKDRKEAESITTQERNIDWYNSTFYTRKAPGAKIIITQTRWHENDLSGHLLGQMKNIPNADEWMVLSFPAIKDGNVNNYDPREVGEALWPDMFSIKDLQKTRITMGIYDWSALYDQSPKPAGGGKIKRHWLKIIDTPPVNLNWSRAWDLAVSTKTTADYTASIAGATDSDGNLYLKDMIRGRWEWPDTRKILIQTAISEKNTVYFEEAGQQKGFIDDLLREPLLQGIPIIGDRPDTNKLTRALPWISRAEAGKVYLVKGDWNNDCLNEMQVFTGNNDKEDDQIDVISMIYKATHILQPVSGGINMPKGAFRRRKVNSGFLKKTI